MKRTELQQKRRREAVLQGSFEHCLEREAVPSIPDVGKLYNRDAQQSANRLVYTRLDLGGILSVIFKSMA